MTKRRLYILMLGSVFLGAAALWLALGFGRTRVVELLYEQGIIARLNETVSRSTVPSVDYYTRKAHDIFVRLTLLLVFFTALTLRWRTRVTSETKHRWIEPTTVATLYVAVSLLVLTVFMTAWSFRGASPKFGFEAMLNRQAHRPFVHRILMPTLVKATAATVPDDTLKPHQPWLLSNSPLKRYYRQGEVHTARTAFAYHLTCVYLFLALMGILMVTRRLTLLVYRPSRVAADIAPAVALFFLPWTFLRGGYMYDFPELLLMGLCLLTLWQRQWLAYYLCFALAMLNKESSLLFVLFLPTLWYGRMDNRQLLRHTLLQLIIGTAILVTIRAVFAGNPGHNIEFHWRTNLAYWTSWQSWFSFHDTYRLGVPLPRGANVITIAIVLFLASYRWHEKPPLLRRLFLCTLAVTLPLFLTSCFKDELRNFSLVFPAFYLLSFHTAQRVRQRGKTTPYAHRLTPQHPGPSPQRTTATDLPHEHLSHTPVQHLAKSPDMIGRRAAATPDNVHSRIK